MKDTRTQILPLLLGASAFSLVLFFAAPAQAADEELEVTMNVQETDGANGDVMTVEEDTDDASVDQVEDGPVEDGEHNDVDDGDVDGGDHEDVDDGDVDDEDQVDDGDGQHGDQDGEEVPPPPG